MKLIIKWKKEEISSILADIKNEESPHVRVGFSTKAIAEAVQKAIRDSGEDIGVQD